MATNHDYEYLSFGDALFLFLERDGTPLNIASLAIFDGEISLYDLRNFVASKLPQIPRYLQRAVVPPFSVGLPHWEFAPDFDIADHIHAVTLKRGTTAELKKVTARILSPVMDRSRPLWDLTLVHGLKNGRTGLVARVHHCLADGISGMGLLNAIMDSSPEVPVLKYRKLRVPRPGVREPGADLIGTAMQSWFSLVERLLHAGTEVLTLARRATAPASNGNPENDEESQTAAPSNNDRMLRLAAELTVVMPERLPFNVVCHGPQRYEWTDVPAADLKQIREACGNGTTQNDIVLTLLTAAFRRYCQLHGVDVRGRSLRIVVPVSTRRRITPGELGNHITFAPFSAPLGIRNGRKLLNEVHDRMAFVKTAHVAEFVAFAGTLLGTIPPPLQSVLAPVLSELPISVCNTICTNVPGPKKPLYLMGHEMLRAYPYVPIGGEMGVNCAVLSYNGTVHFGFTGDVHVVPDLERFPEFVDESIAELKAALGARRRTRTPKPATSIPEPAQPPVPVQEAPTTTTEPPAAEPIRNHKVKAATARSGTVAA